ncbi:MAG: hypothetical protein AAGC53_06445 [Actinomycetota bacterium]
MSLAGPELTEAHRPASSVLVCRGCCCGSATKLPDIDHDAQVGDLRAAAEDVGARFHVVDCLGPCSEKNVVVVRDGSQRHWLGGIGNAETPLVAEWLEAVDEPLPGDLASHLFAAPGERSRRRLLPERGPDLADFSAMLTRGGGAWTMGVPGAIAEFDTADLQRVAINTSAERAVLTATGGSGAMRLHVDPSTRAFAYGREDAPEEIESFLLVRTSAGLIARHGLTELGPDPDPILSRDGDAPLFDIGLGRHVAHFMVRVGDAALAALLRTATGLMLPDVPTEVWQALVEVSPTRVVETALGRVEVDAPIPPPGGVSPTGSHTHLLPDMVALGLDLPEEMTVPKGWHLGPIFYPAR